MKASLLSLLWLANLWFALASQAAVLTHGPVVEPGGEGHVMIRWRTDVSTGSRVYFGKAPSAMDQRADGTQSVDHAVSLTALDQGVTYFYTVGTARSPLATNRFVAPGPRDRGPPDTVGKASEASEPARHAPAARETWGHLASLQDHFDRHGRDFNAKDPEDYARLAWEFLRRAKAEGLPAKIDETGVMRVYDPKTRAFAAYNRNGTTKTFFKPNSRDYFERQPGALVKLQRPN